MDTLAPAWLEKPSDPSALHPGLWPANVVRGDRGALELAGIPVEDLAREFGTPAFFIDERDFRERARAFREAFDDAFRDLCGGVDVYYAGKSFLCAQVVRWAVEEGLRVDTCSAGEMLLAHRALTGSGLSTPEAGALLGLHGNNKSELEIVRAMDFGVGRVVVDSMAEIEQVARLASRDGRRVPVLIRVTPGVHAHTHEFIATAHEDQKFGLSLSGGEAERAVVAALGHESLEVLGLHCHIGSQIFEAEGFGLAARRLLELVARIRQAHGKEQLPEIDLGGGYGIAYTPVDTPMAPTEAAAGLARAVREACGDLGIDCPRVSIEPGRAIVGPTTFTLYRVGTLKEVALEGGSRLYVSVDGGMSDNPRPVLYDADYSAVLANRAGSAETVLARVVGKHCESGDIVVRDCYLPADIERGDLVAVPATGAYCWSLSSNYNYAARPPVVAVGADGARVIVRGETEEDLLARDACL